MSDLFDCAPSRRRGTARRRRRTTLARRLSARDAGHVAQALVKERGIPDTKSALEFQMNNLDEDADYEFMRPWYGSRSTARVFTNTRAPSRELHAASADPPARATSRVASSDGRSPRYVARQAPTARAAATRPRTCVVRRCRRRVSTLLPTVPVQQVRLRRPVSNMRIELRDVDDSRLEVVGAQTAAASRICVQPTSDRGACAVPGGLRT